MYVPAVIETNRTVNEQLAPAASVEPQVFSRLAVLKYGPPSTVGGAKKVNAVVLVLVKVTVCAGMYVVATAGPNVRFVGDATKDVCACPACVASTNPIVYNNHFSLVLRNKVSIHVQN